MLSIRTPTGVSIVGLSLQDVDATMGRLRLVLIAAAGMVIAILALVVFWVLRLGVRPIKRMTKTAGAIAAGDLTQRVPAGQSGTEASELGDSLNAMMTAIEGAFAERAASEARLRRFVADASHELRTPVTTIRGYAELYRHGGLATVDELDQAMRRTEQESVRMASLVDDLLLLARLDEGRPLARDRRPRRARDRRRRRRARVAPDRVVTAEVTEGVTVEGDEDRLRQVIGNLVGNALVHTPEGTAIAVRVHDGDGRAVVEVHDDGPGMEPDVAARAFERFSRADASALAQRRRCRARARHRAGHRDGARRPGAPGERAGRGDDRHGGAAPLGSSYGEGAGVGRRRPARGSGPPAPARLARPRRPPRLRREGRGPGPQRRAPHGARRAPQRRSGPRRGAASSSCCRGWTRPGRTAPSAGSSPA